MCDSSQQWCVHNFEYLCLESWHLSYDLGKILPTCNIVQPSTSATYLTVTRIEMQKPEHSTVFSFKTRESFDLYLLKCSDFYFGLPKMYTWPFNSPKNFGFRIYYIKSFLKSIFRLDECSSFLAIFAGFLITFRCKKRKANSPDRTCPSVMWCFAPTMALLSFHSHPPTAIGFNRLIELLLVHSRKRPIIWQTYDSMLILDILRYFVNCLFSYRR